MGAVNNVGMVVYAGVGPVEMPGRGLMEIESKPVLSYVLERALAVSGVSRVVFSTTTSGANDALAAVAESLGVAVHRLDGEDLGARLQACAKEFGFDAVALQTDDSPLFDIQATSQGVEMMHSGTADIVTTLFDRTFPLGMNVEIVTLEALGRIREAMGPEYGNNPLQYAYDHPDGFSIAMVPTGDKSMNTVTLTLESKEDLECAQWIVASMDADHVQVPARKILDLYFEYEEQYMTID